MYNMITLSSNRPTFSPTVSTAHRVDLVASGELLDHGLHQGLLVQGLHVDAHVFQLLMVEKPLAILWFMVDIVVGKWIIKP